MNPPVPGVEASRKVNGETHVALPAVLMTSIRSNPLALSTAGSTCTCNCRSRSPNTETLDTPGTPISRGRIVQRVSTDWSISDCVSEESPSTMALLDDDTGSIITGGLDTFGSACACVIRSATSCRAR